MELQLFLLYHNEKEIKNCEEDMKYKQHELAKVYMVHMCSFKCFLIIHSFCIYIFLTNIFCSVSCSISSQQSILLAGDRLRLKSEPWSRWDSDWILLDFKILSCKAVIFWALLFQLPSQEPLNVHELNCLSVMCDTMSDRWRVN